MSKPKTIKIEELLVHNKKEDIWVLLHKKVYDLSKFIDEHPGGEEVILAEAGRDATEAFEDVGHSDEARALLPDMFIGDFEFNTEELKKTANHSANNAESTLSTAVEKGSNLFYLAPIGILLAYFAWRYYTSNYVA